MTGGAGFAVILCFLVLLALGFIFEVGKGALDLYKAPKEVLDNASYQIFSDSSVRGTSLLKFLVPGLSLSTEDFY